MDTVSMPYKLQIFLPDDLRKTLKRLANQYDTSMQQFLTALLRTTSTWLVEESAPDLHAAIVEQLANTK